MTFHCSKVEIGMAEPISSDDSDVPGYVPKSSVTRCVLFLLHQRYSLNFSSRANAKEISKGRYVYVSFLDYVLMDDGA